MYAMENIGFKVASALLLHHGELSVEQIKAMPFFRNSDESKAVIRLLQLKFNVETYTKKVTAQPIPQWEEVMRLKR